MGPGEIGLERTDGVSIITFSGEHDLDTAPELRERLSRAIAAGDPIVVDLSGAAFVDSSILGALLDGRREAHESGVGFSVSLADGAEPVERVLEVTGLAENLPVHPSRESAIQAARDGPTREEGG